MVRRKDGLYQEYITVKENGRSKRKYFYGKTKREVLKKLQDYKAAEEVGQRFEDVLDEWWADHERTLAYNTAKSYKPAVQRARDYFEGWYIKNVRPVNINDFLRKFIVENHAAQKTAQTQLLVINLIGKYAVARGYIDSNPARDVFVPRGLKHDRREIASDDDIKRIRYSTDCTFGMFAYWVLYTGLRRSELLALRWNDIDVNNRTIYIKRTMYCVSDSPKLKVPKTTAGFRQVPLMDALLKRLPKNSSGLIFPDDKTGGLMRETRFRFLWGKYCRESGVTCTPHQIRHAYATILYENKIGVIDAQKLLGHAQASTTQDIYTHIRNVHAEQVKETLLTADYEFAPPKKESV